VILADLWHSHHWIDVREWLGALATAAAAIFAAWAIRQANVLAQRAATASLRERQIDHELSVLRAMAEAVGARDSVVLFGLIGMTTLRLPMVRCAFSISPTDEERTAFDVAVDSQFQEASTKQGRSLSLSERDSLMRHLGASFAAAEIAREARELVMQRPSITGVSRAKNRVER